MIGLKSTCFISDHYIGIKRDGAIVMNNYDIKCKLIEEELKTFWPQWHVAKHLGGGAFGDVFEIFRDNFGIRESSALKMIQISDVEETKVLFFSQQEETDIRNQDEQATIPEVFLNEIQVMESLRGLRISLQSRIFI